MVEEDRRKLFVRLRWIGAKYWFDRRGQEQNIGMVGKGEDRSKVFVRLGWIGAKYWFG